MTRKCLNCESDLTGEHGNARYCSYECRTSVRNRKQSISAQRLHALQAKAAMSEAAYQEARKLLHETEKRRSKLQADLDQAREENERLAARVERLERFLISRAPGYIMVADVAMAISHAKEPFKDYDPAEEQRRPHKEIDALSARLSKLQEAGDALAEAVEKIGDRQTISMTYAVERAEAALAAWREERAT